MSISTLAYFSLILFLAVAPANLFAAGVVTNATEADLRAAMVGGGTVTFAVDGTIVLSNTLVITNDTVLDASGRSVVLSGNNAVRVLYVSSGVTLNLTNLTLANGRSVLGGGMLVAGGTVNAWQCNFTGNLAPGANGVDSPYNNTTLAPGGNASGGAICNFGSLWLGSSVLSSNRALGGNGGSVTNDNSHWYYNAGNGGIASGGAIYSSGPITLFNCTCFSNLAIGGTGGNVLPSFNSTGRGGTGGAARGGAICWSGLARMTNCTFQSNAGNGGRGGGGNRNEYVDGPGAAGALMNDSGDLVISGCNFLANGGGPRSTSGGGIHNIGQLQVLSSTFLSNRLDGGGQGAAIFNESGTMTVKATTFIGNAATSAVPQGGYGGPGVSATGGAVFNAGMASLTDCFFGTNSVRGGDALEPFANSGPYVKMLVGGTGSGGALGNRGTADVVRCTLVANVATGGKGSADKNYDVQKGGPGGLGMGGAVGSLQGSVRIVNSTMLVNGAAGGPGGDQTGDLALESGDGGRGFGGAIGATNSLVAITNCTLAFGSATPGQPGSFVFYRHSGAPGTAAGGGIGHTNSTLIIQNSIVSGNSLPEIAGAYAGDHNLVGIDARLGPLADNGGLTKTLALLPDSPAIDAADPASAPTTDQRGVSRPVGSAPDIGAYEWNGTSFYTDFFVRPPALMNGTVNLLVVGPPNQTFRLQTSTSFSGWSDIITNATDSYGLRSLSHPAAAGGLHLYRSVSP